MRQTRARELSLGYHGLFGRGAGALGQNIQADGQTGQSKIVLQRAAREGSIERRGQGRVYPAGSNAADGEARVRNLESDSDRADMRFSMY